MDRKQLQRQEDYICKFRNVAIDPQNFREDLFAPPFESVAVFVCENVSGKDVGKKAIIKIRIEYVRCLQRKIILS